MRRLSGTHRVARQAVDSHYYWHRPRAPLGNGNGPIEGTNTKFKLLRRQMYGRAGFALPRQRILLS